MSLIPNTFDGIVSAIKALAEDDSQEFQNYVPTAIFLAEENLLKKLDTEGFTGTVSVTAVAGNNLVSKPSGHKFNRDIQYRTSSNEIVQPDMKTNDFIKDYWPVGNTSTSDYPHGQPKYYGNDDNDNWVVAPTPASAYVFTVQHGAQITHLSASNQTNYLTDYVPDALYYGTMVGMAEFMKDYQVLQIWQQRYEDAVQAINNEGRRQRRDDNSSPNNRKSGQNTLVGDN